MPLRRDGIMIGNNRRQMGASSEVQIAKRSAMDRAGRDRITVTILLWVVTLRAQRSAGNA